jgi:hypothetical protein
MGGMCLGGMARVRLGGPLWSAGSDGVCVCVCLCLCLCLCVQQVKYYAGRLRELLEEDGLVASAEAGQVYRIAQYDAIFSVGTRRNEVWVVLDGHPW